ncbi:hypothetical protein LRH25_15375 [Ideonella azotifigens]|uniref:Uncharacterized protein n=1 Tax=Ideonella azotifigens TaxID=513160 RepID=A0ABN1K1J7_9BURK|nr:hypothetical protein [Ideonella azotifigens]MCD2341725.1 hypothetical protein [Ideonella azotifigens]
MHDASVRRQLRRLGLVLLSASLVACTTVRPVALNQADKPSIYGRMDDLHLGDKVTIATTDGRTLELKLTEVQRGVIEGKVEGQDTAIRLRDEDIKDIQRVEVSGGKTMGMATGVFVAVVVVPMLLLIRALTISSNSAKNSSH